MAVDKLVAFSRIEIDSANAEALRVQALGRNVLLAVAALSLACSFLIVWLYVGRNIVSRLTKLSSSMAVIVGGGRDLIIDTRGLRRSVRNGPGRRGVPPARDRA